MFKPFNKSQAVLVSLSTRYNKLAHPRRQDQPHKVLGILVCIMCSTGVNVYAKSTSVESISLIENEQRLTLYANGTCSSNNEDIITLPAHHKSFEVIANTPNIARLSGLAILEEVKQQISNTRIVMPLDTSNETVLTVRFATTTNTVSLHSVDLMYQTYPESVLLADFMQIVSIMRESEEYCTAQAVAY